MDSWLLQKLLQQLIKRPQLIALPDNTFLGWATLLESEVAFTVELTHFPQQSVKASFKRATC